MKCDKCGKTAVYEVESIFLCEKCDEQYGACRICKRVFPVEELSFPNNEADFKICDNCSNAGEKLNKVFFLPVEWLMRGTLAVGGADSIEDAVNIVKGGYAGKAHNTKIMRGYKLTTENTKTLEKYSEIMRKQAVEEEFYDV